MHRLYLIILLTLGALTARALPADTYAEASRLASGNWVKIAVTDDGVYHIPVATLRQWGFDNPAAVKVYGYGGHRIPDLLNADTYIDDLPQVQTLTDNTGIYFYGMGTVEWMKPDSKGLMHYRRNPYSNAGYYFLSADADADARTIPVEGLAADASAAYATTFNSAVVYEKDSFSPGESGHMMLGEDFRVKSAHTFSMSLPGRVDNTDATVRVAFGSKVNSGAARLTLTADNKSVTDGTVALRSGSGNAYCDTLLMQCTIRPQSTAVTLGLSLAASGASMSTAALDYITVNYLREIRLDSNTPLLFHTSESAVELKGATASTCVWDITNPQNIVRMDAKAAGSGLRWYSERGGFRRYAAFNPGSAGFPVPTFVGKVRNRNIHGEETPDMVIFTPAAYTTQSERIARMHRESADSLRVLVLTVDDVYDEFASGAGDVQALRKCLKMFYDRGDDNGHRLRYALMMSRPFHDHRNLTSLMQGAAAYPLVPIWQTDGGNDDSFSYPSDDYTVMLADGAGLNPGSDELSIAVGRIPVRNEAECRQYVDKLVDYVQKSPSGEWKNKYVIVADDQDGGEHLRQAEVAVSRMLNATPAGSQFVYNKVYLDAYEKIGGVTEGARVDMFKWLDEGSAWWWYIGHASIDTWSAEKILTRQDISNNLYFRRLPILYAATCSFIHWDGSSDSGAELMVRNPSGGVIAAVCPTRPVYISANGVFTDYMAATMHERDDNGSFRSVAEIVRRAKNRSRNDVNKLRYAVAADPAMRVPAPSQVVNLTSINDHDATASVAEDDLAEVLARSQARFSGVITDADGNPDPTFQGTLYLSIRDAEYTVTTLGRGSDDDPGKVDNFEQQGQRLYAGCDSIRDGHFDMVVAMPSEIADNYRPAMANLYAVAADGREAMGCNRRFIVYGVDTEASLDTEAPLIDAVYLNHESFRSGDTVNESPMAFAHVSDNIGINLSLAGIGHTLLMKLDGSDSYTDVSDYYTPSPDGSPSGTVAYPFSDLTPGNHTLEFRVWDTSNNVSTASIDFYVQPGQAPTIFDVFVTPNPASTEANFYIRHNRPQATITATVDVYDLNGRRIWSGSRTARSDMFVTSPLTWDLSHNGGSRVARGIYIYRATVKTPDGNEASTGGRVAVTAH